MAVVITSLSQCECFHNTLEELSLDRARSVLLHGSFLYVVIMIIIIIPSTLALLSTQTKLIIRCNQPKADWRKGSRIEHSLRGLFIVNKAIEHEHR